MAFLINSDIASVEAPTSASITVSLDSGSAATNKAAYFGIAWQDATGGITVSRATYNGDPVAIVAQDADVPNRSSGTAVLRLIDPADGDNALSVTFSGAPDSVIMACASFREVSQNPATIENAVLESAPGATTSPYNRNIVTTVDECAILSWAVTNAHDFLGGGGDLTEQVFETLDDVNDYQGSLSTQDGAGAAGGRALSVGLGRRYNVIDVAIAPPDSSPPQPETVDVGQVAEADQP
ncbi:MAG: hypothetical protein ACR2P3_05195, partial [Geminicoccaceae bacterium]